MDLKNNEITMNEILQNPAAKALLKREFPELFNPFILGMSRGMTLEKVLEFAKGRVPQEKVTLILSELKKL